MHTTKSNHKSFQKAKHNLIYRIRKRGQGQIDTRARTIYFHFEKKDTVTTSRHKRLQEEYGFGLQSQMF